MKYYYNASLRDVYLDLGKYMTGVYINTIVSNLDFQMDTNFSSNDEEIYQQEIVETSGDVYNEVGSNSTDNSTVNTNNSASEDFVTVD